MLLDGGARVLVTGRSQAGLDSAEKEIGKDAIVVSSDARSLTDLDALAVRAKAEFGTLDLLFVNAGFSLFAPLEQTTEATFDEMFNLNAKGPFFAVQKLSPLITRGGSIVLTTSTANVKGMGQVFIGHRLAGDRRVGGAGRHRVDANPPRKQLSGEHPGEVSQRSLGPSICGEHGHAHLIAQMTEAIPMKRFGTAEELAKAVLFLAFDATFMTGVELPVDGGWSQL
jgi:NAD(P)-dependent dehydrogenase (short-subunit alcohol dehydrogenase family)